MDTQDTLFGPITVLDSRGAMAMYEAVAEALSASRSIRTIAGAVPAFMHELHARGFKIEPCEPIPHVAETATEGDA